MPQNSSNLQGRNAVLAGEHREDVVAERIGDVLGPVGVGPLAGYVALNSKRENADHGKPSILDLLDLELLEDLRVLCKLEGVEGATGVEAVGAIKDGGLEFANTGRKAGGSGACAAVVLCSPYEANLNRNHHEEWQGVGNDAPGNREVVQCAA